MECLTGESRAESERLLDAILDDGRLEFLCTNDEIDFVANCRNTRHIHWPVEWLSRLQDVAATLELE